MLRRKMFRWTSGSNSKPPLQPRQTPFLLRIGAVQQNVAALVVMVAGEGTSGMNGSLPTPCVSNRPTGALFPYTSSALPSEPRHRWYPDPRPACAWVGLYCPEASPPPVTAGLLAWTAGSPGWYPDPTRTPTVVFTGSDKMSVKVGACGCHLLYACSPYLEPYEVFRSLSLVWITFLSTSD